MKTENNLNLNSLVGSIFNAIEVRSKNRRYFVYTKNGYQIIDSNFSKHGTILYCLVKDEKIVGAIEVFENVVERKEQIINTFGKYQGVKNYYGI